MFSTTIIIVALFVCITINSIHKRNKKTELIKEAIKNGYKIDSSF